MKATARQTDSGAVRWTTVMALAAVVLVGLLGSAVASANDDFPPECLASAATLQGARSAYESNCTLPRIDCDKVDGLWHCSSRVIGKVAPGGVRPDDVGGSDIGSSTVVVTTTVASSSSTTAPVTTNTTPPTTAPSTTLASTTAPSTTVPSTTEPPKTSSTIEGTTTVSTGPGAVSKTYPENDGPERNPLKGWNSGWNDDRPESTVGFQYIKWKDLEPRNGVYDFAAVEERLDWSGSRNRHLIIRLYCDWSGESAESRGCPDWIYSEVGVKRLRGDNGKYITDYNDPRYVEQAIQAINALADRYDDDPRMYAVQLGVLGYWGEWHTWGSSINGDRYDITTETESKILNAYREAFDNTHLMARYPYQSLMVSADDLGYHNDYFRPNNGHSAKFDNAVADDRKWLDGPIGGEIPPGLSSDDFHYLYATSQGREMIETGRYSTMKPASVDGSYVAAHRELHKRFGYNFQIRQAQFETEPAGDDLLGVRLDVENIGVAPFYYRWEAQFALLGSDDKPVSVAEARSYDLTSLQPGQVHSWTGSVPTANVASGDYRLAVRVVQPGADDAKASRWGLAARNTYVLFANDMAVVDGSWSPDNRLIGGWSVLGETSVLAD